MGKGGEVGADASGPANHAGNRWRDRIEATYPSHQDPPRAPPCRPTMVADTHLREAIGNRVPVGEGDQINPEPPPWKLTGYASSRRPPTSERQTRKVPTRIRPTRPTSHHHCAATPTSPEPGQGRPPADPCRPRPAPPQRQARSRPRPLEPATDALPSGDRRHARSARHQDCPTSRSPPPPLNAPARPPTLSPSRHRHAQRQHHAATPQRRFALGQRGTPIQPRRPPPRPLEGGTRRPRRRRRRPGFASARPLAAAREEEGAGKRVDGGARRVFCFPKLAAPSENQR
nr:formin-like protein 3 [Aegilops tauschii subsp. strangulata]